MRWIYLSHETKISVSRDDFYLKLLTEIQVRNGHSNHRFDWPSFPEKRGSQSIARVPAIMSSGTSSQRT